MNMLPEESSDTFWFTSDNIGIYGQDSKNSTKVGTEESVRHNSSKAQSILKNGG